MKFHISVCSLIFTLGLLVGVESILNLLGEIVVLDAIRKTSKFVDEVNDAPTEIKFHDNEDLAEVTLKDDEKDRKTETSPRIADSVKFYLYTRKNPDIHQELFLHNIQSLTSSNFNPKKPTRFVIHGYLRTESSQFSIRDAYLMNDDVNVIIVDWSIIAFEPFIQASLQVPVVGQHVAEMIDFLNELNQLDLAETTLVGHSIGAHVAGTAGYFTHGTVNSVVGLDPARWLFETAGPGFRITTEDASYVQIIHTSTALASFIAPIGHADFYPNGGISQPGCGVDPTGICSHYRSIDLFAESIVSGIGFHAKLCNTFLQFKSGICMTNYTAIMGGSPLQIAPPGKYYFTTNSESPYARGIES